MFCRPPRFAELPAAPATPRGPDGERRSRRLVLRTHKLRSDIAAATGAVDPREAERREKVGTAEPQYIVPSMLAEDKGTALYCQYTPRSKRIRRERYVDADPVVGTGNYPLCISPTAPKRCKQKLVVADRRARKWVGPDPRLIHNPSSSQWAFSAESLKRLCLRVGILRHAEDVETELRYEIANTTRAFVRDALLYADCAKAKTVQGKHVDAALARHGLAVWLPEDELRAKRKRQRQ